MNTLIELARSARQAQLAAQTHAQLTAKESLVDRFVADFSNRFDVGLDVTEGLKVVYNDGHSLAAEIDNLTFIYVTAEQYHTEAFLPDGAALEDRLILMVRQPYSQWPERYNPMDRKLWSRPVSSLAEIGALLEMEAGGW